MHICPAIFVFHSSFFFSFFRPHGPLACEYQSRPWHESGIYNPYSEHISCYELFLSSSSSWCRKGRHCTSIPYHNYYVVPSRSSRSGLIKRENTRIAALTKRPGGQLTTRLCISDYCIVKLTLVSLRGGDTGKYNAHCRSRHDLRNVIAQTFARVGELVVGLADELILIVMPVSHSPSSRPKHPGQACHSAYLMFCIWSVHTQVGR